MTSNKENKHTLSASTIRFFRVITTKVLQEGKLMMPNGFTRNHMSDMSNPLFLKTPDGKIWEMCTTKSNGDLWFQKGWKEFATHYSLDHGHMILFQYEENSNFVVHIFGKSTLEIEYPFHDNQNEQNFDQISDDDSVEIFDKPSSGKKNTRQKSPIMCPQPHKKLRSDSSEGVGTSSRFQNLPKHHVQTSEDTGGSTECRKVKHEYEQEQEQEQLTSKINEALSRARSFKSKNPSFKIVMKSSYLYNHFLYVPLQFANNHMKKEQSEILLQLLDGRAWDAKYCSGKIKGGWKKFVADNKLKVGDVCIFELTKSQSLTLKVLIFRLEEEPHSPPLQESVQRDKYFSDVESETIMTNKVGKTTQKTSLRTKADFFSNEAENQADKFNSKYPFFKVNIMPNQRRHSRLHVPISFIREYLDEKGQTLMLKFGSKLWPVKLLCYSNMKSGQFSRGWTQFWEENKLKGGDVCVFELVKRKDFVLNVHIFRGN